MNWLAKINLKTLTERLGLLKSALFLLALIMLCLFVGYRTGNYYHNFQVNTLIQQKSRLDSLSIEQARQVDKINTLEIELAVEKLANKHAQATLKNMEEQHYQVKKQLAFYEKVMAPEKEINGLIIDNVKISARLSSNNYNFQVTLVQQLLKKRYAKGYIELDIIGSLHNKPSQIKLEEISTLIKKDLSFVFKYFQVIEGSFTLPEGFIPEKIQISAVLTKNRWQKYQILTKSIPWILE